MVRNIFSVGGWTIASRLTGFVRDMGLAALLGGGALNDAYVAAIKLPNQFRQIFGEGSFNAAYLPTYTSVLETKGKEDAQTLRQPGIHAAGLVADRPARPRLPRYAAPGQAHLPRIREPAREIRPRGRDVADHVPLHRLHRGVRAASGDAERQQLLERAGGGACGGECLHDRLPRVRRLLSQRLARASPAWQVGDFSPRAQRSSQSRWRTHAGAACSSG